MESHANRTYFSFDAHTPQQEKLASITPSVNCKMHMPHRQTDSTMPAHSQTSSPPITRRALIGTGSLLGAGTLLSGCASPAPSASNSLAQPAPTAVEIVPIPQQAPAKEAYAALPDVRLWYWDTGGDGEVVILLHPFTGSAASWLYQQPAFVAAGYRVIGYSRRGFYKSDAGPKDANVAASVDLAAFTESLGLKRFHLVASAAGAIVAADFALSHPERIRSLVLTSSILGIKDEAISKTLRRLQPPNFNTLPPDFRELGASYRAANPQGTQRWLEIEAQAHLGAPGLSVTLNNTTIAGLNATRLPMLLLTGDADLYMPPSVLQQVAAQLSNSTSVIVDNAGHAAFWEQPKTFNRVVLEFLARHAK